MKNILALMCLILAISALKTKEAHGQAKPTPNTPSVQPQPAPKQPTTQPTTPTKINHQPHK